MWNSIAVERDGLTTVVTLNRPDKLNAFNAEIVDELLLAVQQAEQNDTRLLVFKSNGKGFSGGFDLSDVESSSDGDLLLRFVQVEALLQAVYHAPFATSAFVHGPCYGAAADLVAACQSRVATPDARFRMPGLRFGIVLGTGRLNNLVGSDEARSLLLRDKPFGADEALSKGFVTEICDQTEWVARQDQLLHDSSQLTEEAFEALTQRTTIDTRNADLAALVNSVRQGSIKERIRVYVEGVKAEKR